MNADRFRVLDAIEQVELISQFSQKGREHEYFGIDLELVWTIVVEHIPTLGAQLRAIADSLPE